MIRSHVRVWLPAYIVAAIALVALVLSPLLGAAALAAGFHRLAEFCAVFPLMVGLASLCALPFVIIALVPDARAARAERRMRAGRCHRCNHILHGANRCPECGTKALR